jgi:2-dehydropantoate 2-reductase
MAAGAVGGYFGGRLAAAGHDVAFIARGAHRDAIRRDGLKIESALGDLHLKDVNVTDDPTQIGPVDVVLFAVKLWDTETAGEQTCPLLGPESRVITLQNGVDSVERLAPILGEEATIAGTTYVVTTIAKPGVIHHTGTTARIHCGRLDRRPDARLACYVEQMKAANVDITVTKNMLLDIWKKFVLLSGTSGMTASTRKSLGLIREDADMRALLFKLMHETTAVGRAAGVDLPEDFAMELDRSIAAFPPTMKASMANDLEAGRPLELDWLAGKVVALGRKYGVPTPAQEAVYAILPDGADTVAPARAQMSNRPEATVLRSSGTTHLTENLAMKEFCNAGNCGEAGHADSDPTTLAKRRLLASRAIAISRTLRRKGHCYPRRRNTLDHWRTRARLSSTAP